MKHLGRIMDGCTSTLDKAIKEENEAHDAYIASFESQNYFQDLEVGMLRRRPARYRMQ